MTIHTLEELALSAWPSLQTMYYDGWLLRFANGYTRRANSVNALYQSTGPVDEKIDNCVVAYRDRGLSPVFRMTQISNPADLDKKLEIRGFSAIDNTAVQTLDLYPSDFPMNRELSFHQYALDEWLHLFYKLSRNDPATQDNHRLILDAIPSKCIYGVLTFKGEILACGLGVIENKSMGLFDLVTAPEQRKKGYGTELVRNLLQFGKDKGARFAYLQVMESNVNARRVYEKIGFTSKYTYWYRTKFNEMD